MLHEVCGSGSTDPDWSFIHVFVKWLERLSNSMGTVSKSIKTMSAFTDARDDVLYNSLTYDEVA